jgi:hypothetical protein
MKISPIALGGRRAVQPYDPAARTQEGFPCFGTTYYASLPRGAPADLTGTLDGHGGGPSMVETWEERKARRAREREAAAAPPEPAAVVKVVRRKPKPKTQAERARAARYMRKWRAARRPAATVAPVKVPPRNRRRRPLVVPRSTAPRWHEKPRSRWS